MPGIRGPGLGFGLLRVLCTVLYIVVEVKEMRCAKVWLNS